MKSTVFVAALTVVMFAAGYFSRLGLERDPRAAAPGPQLLAELSAEPSRPAAQSQRPDPLPDPAKVAKAVARLQPELDAFRARIAEIDAAMDERIHALLRPDQEPLWERMIKFRSVYSQREEAGIADSTEALTPEQIATLQERPLYKLLAVVVVPQKLDWLTYDLKLDAQQREQAREVLLWRREQFLALVDRSPPPSLQLSRVAPLASRLKAPATTASTSK